MKYLEGEMRQVRVGSKGILLIWVVLLIIFSTDIVAADYVHDANDICWEVSQSLNVYDVIRGYSEGYVTKEKAVGLLKGARDFGFKKLRDSQVLHSQKRMIGLDPLDELVLKFLGVRIVLISYALYMIEQEKIRPGVASSYELLVVSGLNAVGAGALVEVNDEVGRLRGVQRREPREGVISSVPFLFENVTVWEISRLRSGTILGTRLTGEVVNQSGVTYNSHAWFKVTLYNRAGEVLGWREFTTFEFRDGERKRFKVFFNDVDSSDVDWKIEFERGS